MKRFSGWILMAVVLAVLSTFGEEGATIPIPGNTVATNRADVLWAGMHEAGMIDDEQYQYVLGNGCLPGGSTLTNSPVPVDEQSGWNRMAEHEVITPEQLAYLLYKGTIPDMDEEELNALTELAPVYQPNRAKRLTYEVRRKHARVELIRLAHGYHEKYMVRTANLEERAAALGFQMKLGEAVLVGIDENDEPIYIEPDGIGACDTISADEVWTTNAIGNISTNFNLSGAGVVLAMWEEGRPNNAHQEFAGRITYMTIRDFFDHANAVAAVMMGAGVETNAQGVAPEATLHAYSWHDDFATDLAKVATNGLIRFSNHSYHPSSEQKFGLYTDISFGRDETVYAAYYHLPVMSVSNERGGDPYGYQTLLNGIAKNVLTVGAVEEIQGGYAGTNSVMMTSYSSWGPTDDGRIKPDVVASGWSGWIPVGNSTSYIETGLDGTSFAAPAVTGSLGLLQQLYENLYGTNAVLPLASTWKALLIHTADEAGNAPGPDYRFGWGLANVQKAAELIATNAQSGADHFIKEFMLFDNESSFFQVEVGCSEPLKVTIAWTDPPGSALTNDIDLRIIGPDDVVYKPFVLDPNDPAASATTDDNTIDNVEQVVVTNAIAGFYTVVVGHKDTLANGGQDVSMILSASASLFPAADPTLSLSVSTNGLPLLEWEAVPGALQAVTSTDNLRIPSHWATNSIYSIIRVTNQWVDPAGFSYPARFYKIQEIE